MASAGAAAGGKGGGGSSSKHGTSVKHVTAHKHKKSRSAAQIAAEKKWQAAGTKAEAAKIKGHHRKHATARGLSLTGDISCCSATAVAASARLAGFTVTDADVLGLYLATVDDLTAGASILATLKAASRFGLGGIRPVSWRPVEVITAGAILGTTLPGGTHAVTLDPSGAVWTWDRLGGLDDLAAGPVEEAWVISWQ